MDEKTNTKSIIYEMFDTPASLFFAKTPVHSAEHEGLYRIFAGLIFADAMQYCKNRERFRAYGTMSFHCMCNGYPNNHNVKITDDTIIIGYKFKNHKYHEYHDYYPTLTQFKSK